MRAEEMVVDHRPVCVAPLEASLHVGTEMVAVDMMTQHGIEMAGKT